jgi:hypothetical protein
MFQVCIQFIHQPSQAIDGVSVLDAIAQIHPHPFLGSGSSFRYRLDSSEIR